MNPKKLALGAASVLAAGAIIGGGAALASADPTPSASASASGASADRGSASGTAGQGRQMGGTHTDVTGDEAQKVIDAVKAKDSSATIDTVRKDPDGSYDALGTTSDGAKVMFEVSADLATITQGQGGSGRPGRSARAGHRWLDHRWVRCRRQWHRGHGDADAAQELTRPPGSLRPRDPSPWRPITRRQGTREWPLQTICYDISEHIDERRRSCEA